MIDVVKLVREGKGNFFFTTVKSEHQGYTLHIRVFHDAMTFNAMPVLDWHRKIISDSPIYNGVRLPASAYELQQIADLCYCMMLTPKVIDLIWEQAKIKFPAVIRVNNKIVATSNITDLHQEIERKVVSSGGFRHSELISCVGKYWCLVNRLTYAATDPKLPYKERTACNYGWFDPSAPLISVKGNKLWQTPGFRHDNGHLDPSQCIRLMQREAKLIRPDGTEEIVDLHDIAQNPQLCHLISHEGKLSYLRQFGVPKLEPLPQYLPSRPEPEPEPNSTPSEPETKSENNSNPLEFFFKWFASFFNKGK